MPLVLVPDVVRNLAEFTDPGPDALLSAGPLGGPLRRSNFQEHWRRATAEAGIPDLHFHDLRHTGNTWAAETGATLRDLVDRMGHSTTRAAMIYLHKTAGRDRKIADALGLLIEQSREANPEAAIDLRAQGTERHRDPEGHPGGHRTDRDQE